MGAKFHVKMAAWLYPQWQLEEWSEDTGNNGAVTLTAVYAPVAGARVKMTYSLNGDGGVTVCEQMEDAGSFSLNPGSDTNQRRLHS